MRDYQRQFIRFLVRSGVLRFGEFTTKSGRKTPYFFNMGAVDTGARIDALGRFYARAIDERFSKRVDILFGPAYKGIPLAVAASRALAGAPWRRDVSFSFNRKEVKDHGEGGNLVGRVPKRGDHVLIVEDVTTAGTSVRESMQLFRAFGGVKVIGLIVSVDRMERGTETKNALQELHDEFGLQTEAIVTIAEIVNYLHNRRVENRIWINDKTKRVIDAYREKYGA